MLRGYILLFCAALACQAADSNSWNSKTAASYLDGRAEWWMTWPSAARDHGTFCVSCHTTLPYALSRSSLRTALAEEAPSATERKLIDNVTKRVRIWNEAEPFYKDGKSGPTKSSESRGTEAVLNALVLAAYDRPSKMLTADTRAAFANLWALQITSGENAGTLPWLDFHNRPWEADDSPFYGATLAAIAAGMTPLDYRAGVHQNLDLLETYLKRNYAAQSPINRTVLLWASANLPTLLTPAQRKSLIDELTALQQPDGGWSLTSLAGTWKRRDGSALETRSDGYATGLVTFALEQAGVSREQKPVKSAVAWLAQNQSEEDGRWLAYSLNKERDLKSDVGRFMADAATAYAVLALTATTRP